MSGDVVDRVLRSARYRDVAPGMLARFAAEEQPRARNADDAVKRVKRRLHQAVGAFRGTERADGLAAAWNGNLLSPDFTAACADALRAHSSTRERLAALDDFYPPIWAVTGTPRSVLDLACGLNPLTLPWMGLSAEVTYLATDVDRRPLRTVEAFFEIVGQPHRVEVRDLVADPPDEGADVALLFKLVTTLDRQDPDASERLLAALRVRHAVVSFPVRSLAGRGKGMERTYRARLERLSAGSRIRDVIEIPMPGELLAVMTLDG